MSKETGGSAFPCEQSQKMDGSWNETFEAGMTLRDYFAAKAMQSVLTNESELQRVRNHYYEENQIPAIAAMAYRLADAMIEARSK